MKICVPIQVGTQNQAKKAMNEVIGKADMAELWLDHIRNLNVGDLLKNKPIPVICVCKKKEAKGKFKGSWNDVANILIEAIKNGAEYIDLPIQGLRTQDSGLSRLARKHKFKLILSYHDFRKTPSLKFMLKKAEEMKKKGADIVKISVMAKTLADTVQIIFLAKELQDKKIPHILIAMGRVGVLSRVLTPTLGGGIMFAPLSKGKESASGQLTVDELKEAWELIEN
jgi:3-dehydroquinate dehydratase type I